MTPSAPDKVLRVCVTGRSFHKEWLASLRHIHGMYWSEMDVAARILDIRRELMGQSPGGGEPDVLSPEARERLRRSLGMTNGTLRAMLSRLRSKGFLKGGKVCRRFAPDGWDGGRYRLMIDFVVEDGR